jgi:hypothetical protein
VIGPVQVLVVGLDDATFTGEVMAELARLRDSDIVRLIDVLIVTRDETGALDTRPPPAGLPRSTGATVVALLTAEAPVAAVADPADGAAWSLVDAVPVGSTAAIALIEHRWANPLRVAIRRTGAIPLDETWLTAEDAARLEDLLG